MGSERENLEKLIERIDELIIVLNNVMEDLRIVAASLKSISVSQIPSEEIEAPAVLENPPTQETTEAERGIEDVKMMFPEDLEELLSFEEKDEFIMIKPRKFLGSDNFAKIASIVRGLGGDYISAGRESHFRVPKKKL
ncbi:hypothetical protein H5T51_04850 [Candidatus Bathyarchaeota archaeon]|nr:hypothetical protein [Candidatus Bathyarchaeota archaeon]